MLRFLSTGLASAVIVRRLFRHNGGGVAELEPPPVMSQAAPKPQLETPKPGGLLGYLKTTFSLNARLITPRHFGVWWLQPSGHFRKLSASDHGSAGATP